MTLPADLETMDLLTTATPPPTLRGAGSRRLRNDFEDSFGTRRPQLIRCADEITLPLLTSRDLLVVDKPAGAMPRSDESTEQILEETTRPCPRCFVLIRRAGWCVHMKCDTHRCQHEFCCLCLHEWTSAAHDSSFCTGRAKASSGVCGEAVTLQLGATGVRHAASGRHDAELFSAEDADVPLRWRRFLEFYDHRETRIRATAEVVFARVAALGARQVVAPTVSRGR